MRLHKSAGTLWVHSLGYFILMCIMCSIICAVKLDLRWLHQEMSGCSQAPYKRPPLCQGDASLLV